MIRPLHHPDNELLPSRQMQSDISAVIDVGAREFGSSNHARQNFFCHGARDRSHRRNEVPGSIRHDRRQHAAGDPSARPFGVATALLSEESEFAAELVEYGHESRTGSLIRQVHFTRRTKCLHNEVDGAILQVQATAIWQHSHLCTRHHLDFAPASSGQGLSFRAAIALFPTFSVEIEPSDRTWSRYPPNAP